jgi:hypothetical protein
MPRRRSSRRSRAEPVKPGAKTLLAAAGIWAVTGLHAGANTAAGLDAVSVFNRICYSKVPSTEAVEKMALELGWNLLVPKDMEAFGKPDEFSYFRGWDVQVGEQVLPGRADPARGCRLARAVSGVCQGNGNLVHAGAGRRRQDVGGAMRELAGRALTGGRPGPGTRYFCSTPVRQATADSNNRIEGIGRNACTTEHQWCRG